MCHSGFLLEELSLEPFKSKYSNISDVLIVAKQFEVGVIRGQIDIAAK